MSKTSCHKAEKAGGTQTTLLRQPLSENETTVLSELINTLIHVYVGGGGGGKPYAGLGGCGLGGGSQIGGLGGGFSGVLGGGL